VCCVVVLLSDVGGRRYVVIVFVGFLLPRNVLFGVVGCVKEFLESFVMMLLTLLW